MRTIKIPDHLSNEETIIEVEKNLIIVGANGAGKTRFGSRIEGLNNPSKRISAQRYLQFNETFPRTDFESAKNQLNAAYKNQAPISPQSDFHQVFVSLFAEEARRDSKYVADSKATSEKISVPQSVKERVVDVWNFIFPYRPISLENDRVRASNNANNFSGIELSDGEKVGLYLISQILLAEDDCLLVIDEPELHLHKALMVRLWNKLEELRPDCTFVYITHDLDFAVSKPATKSIWIQSFINNQWKWEEIEPNGIIPDNLFLEVLGSRKNVLFVEGTKGSLDVQIYQAYYENLTVIPRGSCEKVIESVKGLKSNDSLHALQVFGLIDRDFRPEEQLMAFRDQGIFSIALNKIENLFLLPEILQMVSTYIGKNDKYEGVITSIKEAYQSEKERIDFAASKFRMQRVLNEQFGSIKNREDYEKFKREIFDQLDSQIISSELPQIEEDVIKILEVYPYKGLVKKVQNNLEFSKDGYRNLVLSFFSSDKRKEIIEILKQSLPNIV